MNNLYVYGCSFSEPFGIDNHWEAKHDQNGYRIFEVDFWGTHLAKSLGMTCKAKSLSGVGWNYINDKIDEDIIKWDDDDIIIISPSFFTRATFEEFIDRASQPIVADKLRSWNEIYSHNETRWRHKIKTLQYLGYRVFTWLVDSTPNAAEVSNLITAEGFYNWKDWMDIHKEYWTDPTTNKFPLGDWHFNKVGHIAVAKTMEEFIRK